jgi:hypothetical protein
VETGRVVSWSLNVRSFLPIFYFSLSLQGSFQALNNTETLRLLTIIELACPYSGKSSSIELQRPKQRRVDRIIKDDRRRRHKRRKDADALVDAFARSTLEGVQQDNITMPSGTPVTAT